MDGLISSTYALFVW